MHKLNPMVRAQAMRLAREVIKNTIRRARFKVSFVRSRDINEAARQIVDTNPAFADAAKEILTFIESIDACGYPAPVPSKKLMEQYAEKQQYRKALKKLPKTQARHVPPLKPQTGV